MHFYLNIFTAGSNGVWKIILSQYVDDKVQRIANW